MAKDEFHDEKQELKPIQQFANKFKLLTREEEFALTSEYYDLKTTIIPAALRAEISVNLLYYLIWRRESLEEELINKNLRLVLNNAQKPSYVGRGLSMYDLFMEGFDGLRYALRRKFNPYQLNHTGKPNKFSTYSTYWIKQRIGRAIEKKGNLVKVAGHVHTLMSKIRKVTGKFVAEKGMKPSAETILKLLHIEYPDHPSLVGVTPERIAELGRLGWQHVSLNEEISTDEGNITLIDYLVAPETYQPEIAYEDVERKEQVSKMLSYLPDDERLIIAYSFGIIDYVERTPKQIAKLLGITLKDCQAKYQAGMDKLKELAL